MLIIIEGVDGSGKSILAKKLEKQTGYKLLPVIPIKHNHEVVWEFYINDNENIYITDRSFITDVVYRSFDDKGRNFDPTNITKWLMSGKITIVHCETETSYEDSMIRGEDNITDREHHEKIKQMYHYYLKHVEEYLNSTVIKYDWRKDKLKGLIQKLKTFPNGYYNYCKHDFRQTSKLQQILMNTVYGKFGGNGGKK